LITVKFKPTSHSNVVHPAVDLTVSFAADPTAKATPLNRCREESKASNLILKPSFQHTYKSISITVAVTDSIATMPPRCQPPRAAQQPQKTPAAPSYAAATATSSLAAAAAAAAYPTPAEAAVLAGGTTGSAISGNTGARPPIAASNSDPSTNINSEGNTTIAALKISDDMDTRAAALAKRPADSPSRVIEKADPKKTQDSEATPMDTVSDAANWYIFVPPEYPMWPDETKKLSTRLNDMHYGRIMDGFTEEEKKLARKKFEGVSKKPGPGVDTNDYLAHRMPDLLDGISQLTIDEHRHILEHGLPLDTWYRGFAKLARCTFTATDYLTEEDILECRILMCRLAYTNPGPIRDIHKSLMHATVEATAWAGCVRAVGTLYAHSPPPTKGSLKDSKITNYLLPSQPKTPQGATPPLVKRSVVVQTPSPLTPAATSPARPLPLWLLFRLPHRSPLLPSWP